MIRDIFKPKWNEPCLCGSGKKFRECCWKRLPGFDIGKLYSQEMKKHKFERALLACRADIVQYTIWHKTNTEPMLARGGPAAKLLQIDVNALGAYIERLLWLYVHTNRGVEWPTVMDRVQHNIRHIKWQRKIVYFRALAFLGPEHDVKRARQELKKAGPITTNEDDIELLQIFIDLELENEPFSTRLAYFDRIISLSSERSDQLQYRAAKAVQYFLIGDRITAESELSDIADFFRKSEADEPLSNHERVLAGRILQLLGSLRDDSHLLKKSIDRFSTLLLSDNWTDVGRAGIYRDLGDSYKYNGDWEDAETAYREALALDNAPLDRIHIAECLLSREKLKESASEIDNVDRNLLDKHGFSDYVFAFSAISVWLNDQSRLKDAKTLLESLVTTDPYFNERRLTLLLRVTETLASGQASVEAKVDSRPERGVASASSSFFLLQPNIMGIGINFNAIIDYLLKKKPTK